MSVAVTIIEEISSNKFVFKWRPETIKNGANAEKPYE